MSSPPSKMTFAQKLMAKMGHVEGQGLGKDGGGITDPIRDSGKFGRSGLGFDQEDNMGPRNHTTPFRQRGDFDINSTVVYITRLPRNSEPKFVMTLFGYNDVEKIEELYTPTDNYAGEAWAKFKTQDDAAEAAASRDGQHFGPNSQKITTSIIAEELAPFNREASGKNLLRYSDSLRKMDPATISATVFVTNLPPSGPISNINEMEEKIGRKMNCIKVTKIIDDGVLIRFESISDAEHFHDLYNGEYWKNDTLHVDFRPDSEMDDLMDDERERKAAAKESTKLFVSNARGLSEDQIREAFLPVELNDVQVNPSGFAFVFLAMTDAITILDKFPNGIKMRSGRKIYANPPKDKKGIAALAAARLKMTAKPAATGLHPIPSTNALVSQTAALIVAPNAVRVKLTDLAYAATEQDVRRLFNGFRLCGPEVVIKKGYGFVFLPSDADAEQAVSRLNKRYLRGKAVTMKVAGIR